MVKTNTNQTNKYKVDLFRLILCAVLVSVMMIIMFNIYKDNVAEKIQELTEKKDHENTIWFIKHVAASIPTWASAIVMCLVYSNKDRYVPVKTQKEKLYVAIILACVTVMMLVYVKVTDGVVNNADEVESLFEKTFTWFIAQILPLSVLISYHAVRMGSEKHELEEAEANK